MLNIVRDALLLIVNDIDSGNSKISEQLLLEILDMINKKELNRTLAADYIGKSISTFDNYVRKGIIPEGNKREGASQKFWYKSDLDKFLKTK